jgi:hypothetical protein
MIRMLARKHAKVDGGDRKNSLLRRPAGKII